LVRRESWAGQVVEEAVELVGGAGGVRRGHPLLELLRLQPALGEMVAQGLHGLLPLGGADADRTRLGCAHVIDGTAMTARRDRTGSASSRPGERHLLTEWLDRITAS
jgi:hypothetical protein